MMITLGEAVRGLYGAWRLIHFDRSASQFFDGSVRQFWMSFWAAAICLPGEIILRLLFVTAETGAASEGAEPGLVALTLVFVIAYVVQWVGFALLMVYVTDMLNRFENYLAYMAAHNWSAVVQVAIVLPAAAVFVGMGIGQSGWGGAIFFAAVLATWVYLGFIARTMLGISKTAAAFVVITEIALALGLSSVSEALLGRV